MESALCCVLRLTFDKLFVRMNAVKYCLLHEVEIVFAYSMRVLCLIHE